HPLGGRPPAAVVHLVDRNSTHFQNGRNDTDRVAEIVEGVWVGEVGQHDRPTLDRPDGGRSFSQSEVEVMAQPVPVEKCFEPITVLARLLDRHLNPFLPVALRIDVVAFPADRKGLGGRLARYKVEEGGVPAGRLPEWTGPVFRHDGTSSTRTP